MVNSAWAGHSKQVDHWISCGTGRIWLHESGESRGDDDQILRERRQRRFLCYDVSTQIVADQFDLNVTRRHVQLVRDDLIVATCTVHAILKATDTVTENPSKQGRRRSYVRFEREHSRVTVTEAGTATTATSGSWPSKTTRHATSSP